MGLVCGFIWTAMSWMSLLADAGATWMAVTSGMPLALSSAATALTVAESAAVSGPPSRRSVTMIAAGVAACGNDVC